MVRSTELYDILEVEATCTSGEIKQAYRRLAMQHHPDKNADNTHEKFQAIQGAYEILSDPDKRDAYDRFGLSAAGGGGGWSDDDDDDGFPMGMRAEDLFAHMFGGGAAFGGSSFNGGRSSGSGGSRKRQKRPARGEDEVVNYPVDIKEAYTGKETTIELDKQVVCTTCKGTGCKAKATPRKCAMCKGSGQRVVERMFGPGFVTRQAVECDDCRGEGEAVRPQDACKKCKGTKTISSKTRVGVYIERGAQTGDRIVLRGEGDQYPDQRPGDVILIIMLLPHISFVLVPQTIHLQTEVTLTLSEALLGFDRLLLTHLDGRGIRVSQPPPGQPGHRVFSDGDVFKVKGEGYPKRKSETRGDLVIRVEVEMPTSKDMAALTKDGTSHLEKLLPPKRPDVIKPEITDTVSLQKQSSTRWKVPEDYGARTLDDSDKYYDDEVEPNAHEHDSANCRQQ